MDCLLEAARCVQGLTNRQLIRAVVEICGLQTNKGSCKLQLAVIATAGDELASFTAMREFEQLGPVYSPVFAVQRVRDVMRMRALYSLCAAPTYLHSKHKAPRHTVGHTLRPQLAPPGRHVRAFRSSGHSLARCGDAAKNGAHSGGGWQCEAHVVKGRSRIGGMALVSRRLWRIEKCCSFDELDRTSDLVLLLGQAWRFVGGEWKKQDSGPAVEVIGERKRC